MQPPQNKTKKAHHQTAVQRERRARQRAPFLERVFERDHRLHDDDF
jgi:hypothetical protein